VNCTRNRFHISVFESKGPSSRGFPHDTMEIVNVNAFRNKDFESIIETNKHIQTRANPDSSLMQDNLVHAVSPAFNQAW